MPKTWLEYLIAKPPILPILIVFMGVVLVAAFLYMVRLSRASLRNIHTARSRLSKYDMRYEEAMQRQDAAMQQQDAQSEMIREMVKLLSKQNELLGQALDELRRMSGNKAP